jgi:hypothetical protein
VNLTEGRLVRPAAAAAAVICAAVTAAGCQIGRTGNLAGRASDEWSRSYHLAPGGEFQIVNARGNVAIRGGSGPDVEVRAERIARAADDQSAREIVPRIVIREDAAPDKVVLQTEGLGGIVIGVEVSVDYSVTVPPGIEVRARSVAGTMTAADVRGPLVLTTADGTIAVTNLSAGIDARTVNGDVTVDLAAVGTDPVDLRATNGSVELLLPPDANANLLLNVTNGSIDTGDLQFERTGEQNRRRVRGRMNSGGVPIEMTAINGSVRVRPRP